VREVRRKRGCCHQREERTIEDKSTSFMKIATKGCYASGFYVLHN
jgi:hypothetical protein